MTDEQQIHDLLIAATVLPDELPAPVQRLVRLGHSRQRRRTRARTAAVGAVAVVAVAATPIIHAVGPGRPGPSASRPPSGPPVSAIARYHWSPLPASPLGARTNPVTVMAGKELIELIHNHAGGTTFGAAFDPAARRWRLIASLPANVGFDDGVTAWTGHQLFFVGVNATCGTPGAICLRRAGLYDPATNRWTITALPRVMDTFFRLAASWDGRDVILAAADSSNGGVIVASYDPITRRWRIITPPLSARHPTRFVAMVATPGRVILWSFWGRFGKSGSVYSEVFGVDVLALGGDGTWRNVTDHWPRNQWVPSPVLAGQQILVSPAFQLYCGVACSGRPVISHGYFLDPATLRRMLIPLGPVGRAVPAFIWTGQAIIAMNLYGPVPPPHPLPLDSIALFNPK